MKLTPEEMARELAAIEALPLRAVILYGSAAAGDQAGARSDCNLMVVLDRLGRAELDVLAGPTRRWIRSGNPPPLLFTQARLTRSADVFPIELQDLKESGRILYGEHVLADVRIQAEHLRLEIEHELKGKLAHLQSEYVHAGGRARLLRALMVQSLSTFLVLARALLRFFEPNVPPEKMEALRALRAHTTFDLKAFEAVQALKERREKPDRAALIDLFGRYLAAVEELVVTADTKLDSGGGVTFPAAKKPEQGSES